LVVAARIEPQCPKQLAVLGEDPHVQIGHQGQDPHPGVAPAQPDVMQTAVVAQGDAPVAVDPVSAHPAVGGDDRPGPGRSALGRATKAAAGVRRPIPR
jgi:hypothetical protein